MECEFTINVEAGLAQQQVWNQKNEKKKPSNFNQCSSHLGPATSWELEE
jgi:hypothetical protein